MLTYVIRRILATIPVVVVVALFVFSLLFIAPGDPAAVIAGEQATPEQVERIRQNLGLDRPFLVQFSDWSWRLLHADLGRSIFTNLPVTTMIAQRVEPTLSLMLVTLVFSIIVAVPIGVLAAWKVGSLIDRAVMGFAVFGFSVPVFVVGYLLAYVFALELEWLPVQGYTPIARGFWPWLENLILPSIALGCAYIALIARITRASMLEVLQQDYIRTARAKGLRERQVVMKHGVRSAVTPIVTILGIDLGVLLGGAILTETVFNIPGIGRLAYTAITRGDMPTIQGTVIFAAFFIIVLNLIVDIAYSFLDPRVRY
jgi:peptide/nickel transport system permease protein